MKKNVWLVRPKPHGTDHLKEFLKDDFIAIGYPIGTDLSGISTDVLRSELEKRKWSVGLGNILMFLNEMNVGDFVIVPSNDDIYISEITSDYKYICSLDQDIPGSGYPHQREVKWFFDKMPVSRGNIPEEIRASLRFPGAVADLSKHYDLVLKMIENGIKKPENFTEDLKEEAKQVLRELLNSDNVEHRLKAAAIILGKDK